MKPKAKPKAKPKRPKAKPADPPSRSHALDIDRGPTGPLARTPPPADLDSWLATLAAIVIPPFDPPPFRNPFGGFDGTYPPAPGDRHADFTDRRPKDEKPAGGDPT